MSAWQPIETAPKDGTKIDLWVANQELGRAIRETDMVWHHFDDGSAWAHADALFLVEEDGWTVTHWMPLPEPPQVQP